MAFSKTGATAPLLCKNKNKNKVAQKPQIRGVCDLIFGRKIFREIDTKLTPKQVSDTRFDKRTNVHK